MLYETDFQESAEESCWFKKFCKFCQLSQMDSNKVTHTGLNVVKYNSMTSSLKQVNPLFLMWQNRRLSQVLAVLASNAAKRSRLNRERWFLKAQCLHCGFTRGTTFNQVPSTLTSWKMFGISETPMTWTKAHCMGMISRDTSKAQIWPKSH